MNIIIFDIAIFITCAAIYWINQLFLKSMIGGNFLMFHFNDFLAIIVFMSLANITLVLFRPYVTRIDKLHHILILAIICGIFWEVITPLYKESTADWLDLFCYIAGSLCYWVINRIFLKKELP
ncbi:MAG: hypothetical protein R3Y50_05000 [Rikenellaceae bacterium]